MRRAAAAALVVLAASWALTFALRPWSDERVSDLFVYRSTAAPLLRGALPYRDVAFEYPPLAAVTITLPGAVSASTDGYRLAFAAEMLVLAAAVLLLTAAVARATGGDPRLALAAVALAPLLTGAMVRTHFDLAPVALTLGALLCICRGRPTAGFVLLGLGTMTKGFPLVVAPVALAWLIARGQRPAAARGVLALACTVAAIGAVALAASPGGALDAVRYHLDRPAQVESAPAYALRALDGAGFGHARSVSSFRSDGLLHPASGVVQAAFALALLAVLGALAYAVARGPGRPDERRLVLAALGAVAAFAALGKVLSPQFMVWIVPLAALALSWRMYAPALLAAAAMGLTLVEFPSRYFDLVAGERLPVVVVGVRDATLLALVGVALARVWRAGSGGGQEDRLDRGGAAVGVGVDQHGVQPRVVV